jgi:hypothetical protein
MKIAHVLSVALVAGIVGAGTLLVTSSETLAMPANGAAIAHAAQQADPVIKVRSRCPNGQVRDQHGYCRPSGRGF